jgi:hypothetical protein
VPKIRFEGTFLAAGHESLRDLVSDWIGWPTVKLRTIGEELVYSDDSVYLYCQSAPSTPGPLESFLVEGSYTGELNEGRAWLDQLTALCARHGIGCDLVGSPLDDHGAPAGEEFEIEVVTR